MPDSDVAEVDETQLAGGDQVPDFQVRLTIDVSAGDAFEAVDAFIEKINQFGLRSFVFRVLDHDDEEVSFIQGDLIMSEDELRDKLADDGAN